MNLDNVDGEKNRGLDLAHVDAPVARLLAQVPEPYRRLLTLADGITLASGGRLYGSGEILERNATYEVAAYLPGHVAIGDDGGGRLFVVQVEPVSPVMCVGMGALGSVPPDVVAGSIEAWIDRGCPAQGAAAGTRDDLPDVVDVYLDRLPGGKLTGLLAIKSELGLDISMSQLKTLAEALPARIASNVPYGKFRKRCDALNARLGACLSLRPRS